jgi:hypothetical protein
MDLSTLASSLQAMLGAQLPGILGALGILIIGWLIAVTARAGTRRLLAMLKVNARIEESLLGGAILVIGFWLANLVYEAIDKASGERTTGLARIARLAILGLVIAMGLGAMGIADDIVNLAFGLTLGAIAVAFALSFGLGGREAAGRQMEHWLSRLRKGD